MEKEVSKVNIPVVTNHLTGERYTLNEELPHLLFKFMPPPNGEMRSKFSKENFDNIILKGQIRMTGVTEVNDPFDCFPNIIDDLSAKLVNKKVGQILRNPLTGSETAHIRDELLKKFPNRKARKANEVEVERMFRPFMIKGSRNFFNKFGFFSLSANAKSPLMWAHYAANHHGICLGFSTRGARPAFGLAEQVKYSNERPQIHLSDAIKMNKAHLEEIGNALVTKSKDWKYEEEWRYISGVNAGLSNSGDIIQLNDSRLKVIILGMKSKPEVRSYIENTLAKSGSKNVKILKAKMSNEKFKIRIFS